MKLSIACAFALSAVALHSASASALPITFDFSGNIYLVDSSIAGNFSVGDSISGSYTFESTTVGQPFSPGGILDPSITYYPNVLTAFEAMIGSYVVSLGSANRIFVINNDIAGRDRYLVELLTPTGADVAALPISNFFLSFQDNNGLVLGDGALPLSPTTIASFPSAAGALDFVDNTGRNRVTFSINSVTVPNPVPLPATIWLFSSGLLGLVGVVRRKKA